MDSSKEFLNPSSMLTPGLAGGMTMAITNSVAGQFDLVAPGPAYLGLGLSFLFGLLVWMSQEVSHIKRAVLYVLNSLVIFVVAMGSNSMGTGVSATTKAASLGDMLMSSAYAAPEPGWCCAGDRLTRSTRDECSKSGGRFATQEAPAKAACERPTPAKEPPKDNRFFRPWVR
jgi:hypothetical protein